jgi:hypothetical protein
VSNAITARDLYGHHALCCMVGSSRCSLHNAVVRQLVADASFGMLNPVRESQAFDRQLPHQHSAPHWTKRTARGRRVLLPFPTGNGFLTHYLISVVFDLEAGNGSCLQKATATPGRLGHNDRGNEGHVLRPFLGQTRT